MDNKSMQEIIQKWNKIVAKAWMDPKFKQELLANPEKVLKEGGINLPGAKIHIKENTKQDIYFTLPMKPDSLSASELKGASGGGYADEQPT